MANSGLTQRQLQPNNSYHCKDCGVYFDSIKSLDVHLHYHKENLLSKWATQSAYAQEESNNNTSHKNGNNAKQQRASDYSATIAAAADSSDSMLKTNAQTRTASSGGFGRGSPPVNVVYSHQSSIANYNNVSSPFHNHEQHRFSPSNGHPMFPYHNGMPNKTPPPNNPPFQAYPQPHPSYMTSMRSPGVEGFFDTNNLQQQNYSVGSEQFTNAPSIRSTTPSSVSSPSSSSSAPGYRYHPYQHTSPYGGGGDRGVVSSSSYPVRPTSPQQCEKCGTICDTSAALAEHLSVAHPPTPVGQFQGPPSGARVGGFQLKQEPFEFHSEIDIKTEEDESQAEILDLDSHKVHVYQPPEEEDAAASMRGAANGNPHSVSAMLWGGNHHPLPDKSYRNMNSPPERKAFHPLGRNPTPDFGVTSTLTSPQPELVPQSFQQQQRYHQVPDLPQPGIQPQQPITSTQVPNSAASLPNQPTSPQVASRPSSGGKNNASWKSNEARRPKTYNCSACNKWFTSSGHLKRHYNTTLHKNAVKQSGHPDPAAMPINAHHHPDRDPNYVPRGSRGGGGDHTGDSMGSPVPSLGNEDSSRSDEYGRMTPQHMQQMMPLPVNGGVMQNGGNLVQNHPMMTSPPNRLAGPSEYDQQSGGLLSLVPSPQANYIQEMESSVHRQTIMRGGTTPPSEVMHHLPSPPQLLRRLSPPPPQLMQQPHMLHHPHPVALLTNAQMEQQMMQTYPNAQPPHVITNQTPQITNIINTNQITSIGNSQNGNINILSDNAIFEELQPMQHFFGNNMFQMQPQQQLPSFSQFTHQNYQGQALSMLHGFNGLVPPPSYMVPPPDHVGGLLPSPSNNHHQQQQQTLLMESFNNNNNYMGSDVTSLSSVDRKHMTNNNNNNHHHINNSNSDSSTSLGEDVLSPIGTPDCPTSTISGDFDIVSPKIDDSVTVSSTNETINVYSSVSISNGTIHKCIDCDKVFNKACYLTQHNKSFHSGAKPYKCNRCGKRFLAEYQYEEHLLKHAPDKPYKCEICPKQFNHKTDLRRHLCLHTGEKPYSCETCGKGFIRKDHMLKHCITHRRKINLQQQQQQQQQQHHIIAQ